MKNIQIFVFKSRHARVIIIDMDMPACLAGVAHQRVLKIKSGLATDIGDPMAPFNEKKRGY